MPRTTPLTLVMEGKSVAGQPQMPARRTCPALTYSCPAVADRSKLRDAKGDNTGQRSNPIRGVRAQLIHQGYIGDLRRRRSVNSEEPCRRILTSCNDTVPAPPVPIATCPGCKGQGAGDEQAADHGERSRQNPALCGPGITRE